MRLQDRVALITGGGSGIGAAAARHMAAAGAKIAVCGIPADGVNEVAASLRADGFEAIGLPADVADEKQVEAAVEKTAAKFGPLDIAVASAAVQLRDRDHTLHELDTDAWDLTHSINFRGTMLTCKYALQQMLPQQSGAIVIISSVTAMGDGSPNVAYLTGKHACSASTATSASTTVATGSAATASAPARSKKPPTTTFTPIPKAARSNSPSRFHWAARRPPKISPPGSLS